MVSKTTITDGYRDERDDGVYMHVNNFLIPVTTFMV